MLLAGTVHIYTRKVSERIAVLKSWLSLQNLAPDVHVGETVPFDRRL